MTIRDKALIASMLDFARRVETRIIGVSQVEFSNDVDIQDLVLYPLGQLGEKAYKLSEDFTEKYKEVSWAALRGIRNRLFHSYEDIDMVMVYQAASINIPQLVIQLENIIRVEGVVI